VAQSDNAAGPYDAFGVVGTALEEKIGVFHSMCLKLVPKTPNASQARRYDRHLQLSEDGAALCWGPSKAKPAHRIPVDAILRVTLGHQSEVFRLHRGGGDVDVEAEASQPRSFSIWLAERTVDLSVPAGVGDARADAMVCRGAWARVTMDQFRYSALETIGTQGMICNQTCKFDRWGCG
jgi:hypothetical protein